MLCVIICVALEFRQGIRAIQAPNSPPVRRPILHAPLGAGGMPGALARGPSN